MVLTVCCWAHLRRHRWYWYLSRLFWLAVFDSIALYSRDWSVVSTMTLSLHWLEVAVLSSVYSSWESRSRSGLARITGGRRHTLLPSWNFDRTDTHFSDELVTSCSGVFKAKRIMIFISNGWHAGNSLDFRNDCILGNTKLEHAHN